MKGACLPLPIEAASLAGLSVFVIEDESLVLVNLEDMLADLGCGIAQGTLISLPVPAARLPEVVAHWRRPGP